MQDGPRGFVLRNGSLEDEEITSEHAAYGVDWEETVTPSSEDERATSHGPFPADEDLLLYSGTTELPQLSHAPCDPPEGPLNDQQSVLFFQQLQARIDLMPNEEEIRKYAAWLEGRQLLQWGLLQ